MRGKVTKERVDALKPEVKPIYLWDDKLAGFGCKITPTGRKVYLVQYRAGGGRRAPTCRVTIGVHGLVTTEQARKKAKVLLGDVANGSNPARDRADQRKAPTIGELADEYVADCERGIILHRGRLKSQWTIDMDKGKVSSHIKPLLGTRRVIDLTTRQVEDFQADIIAGKTARQQPGKRAPVRGGPSAASGTVATLGAMFGYAIRRGWRNDNPCRGVARPKAKERNRRLTAEEYRRLGEAIAAEMAPMPSVGAAAIRFLALSGWRKREATELVIPADDFGGSSVVLERTKTGRSVRPLGRDAITAAREAVTTFKSSRWVFPGRAGGPCRSVRDAFRTLAKTAKLTGVTIHTLRHSFASEAADLGYADSTIAGLLGHGLPGVTSRYIHRADAALVAAANHVARHISTLMAGRAEPAQVVEIARAVPLRAIG